MTDEENKRWLEYQQALKDPNISAFQIILTYGDLVVKDPEIRKVLKEKGLRNALKAGKKELKKTSGTTE